LNKESTVNIITANTPLETRVHQQEFALTGYVTEYVGGSILFSRLNRLFKCDKISIAMEAYCDWGNVTNEDLLIFGGPVNNPLSKRLCEVYSNELPFHFNEYSLVSKDGAVRFDSLIDTGGIQKDYAMIINTVSPFDPSKRTIMIAGCRTMGCLGGALFMNDLKSFTFVKKSDPTVFKHNSYTLIIEVHSHNFSVLGKPRLVKVATFDV
jgi:hypothetical protein